MKNKPKYAPVIPNGLYLRSLNFKIQAVEPLHLGTLPADLGIIFMLKFMLKLYFQNSNPYFRQFIFSQKINNKCQNKR